MKNNKYTRRGKNQKGFIPYKEMVTQQPTAYFIAVLREVTK